MTAEANSSLPSIRVAVAETCNLRCDYCPTDGDSVAMQAGRLGLEAAGQMVQAAIEVGFTDFSLTGGEPLLSDQTAERTFLLAARINKEREATGRQGYTKLNTNGANLLRYKEAVLDAGFSELKVSLDTLKGDTFKRLAKRSEKVLAQTIEGILAVKDAVPVRLQTVVGKYNYAELADILQFCMVNGLDIKLFDISRYGNALAGSGAFADANYVSLAEVGDQLEESYGLPAIKFAVGGYGHAKKVFTTSEGTMVELRDTSESAHYSSELCHTCPKYMCQDGLCNLVIAADGHIRFCREGGAEQTIPAYNEAAGPKSYAEVKADFVRAAGIFAVAQNVRRVIQPGRKMLPLIIN